MSENSSQSQKNRNWVMLFLLWLMFLIAYLDRVNIAIAGPMMMKELGMSPLVFGTVLSSFSVGYAFTQIPGGYFADKYGAKRMIFLALIWWSVFTGITGMVSSVSLLIVVRVLFGIGEGMGIGAQFKLVGDFFTSAERSKANALFLTALALGPAFVAPISVWLLGMMGWRELFYWFAIPGFVMSYLIYKYIPEKPAGGIVHTEVLTKQGGSGTMWRDVVAYPSIWLLFFTYMFFNIAFWGFLLWLPSYLSMSRHIELKAMGFYASLPYIFGFFGLLVMGWLGSSKLFYHNRAHLIAGSYLIAGIALFVAFTQETAMSCLIALSCAGFFLYGGFGPFWAVALDLIPDNLRATLTGFVNVGGQIGGASAPIVVGAIVSATGSFFGGFVFMTAGLIGASILLVILQAISKRRVG